MISYICREKELRQKELLKMMGVQESDIGWSWFGSYLVVYWIVATMCALVSSKLYTNSTGFIIWLFWIFTFTALVVFSMLLASLSAKSTRVSSFNAFFVMSSQGCPRQTHDLNTLLGCIDRIDWSIVCFHGSVYYLGRRL